MVNIVRLIGDVHGKFSRYEEIIKDCPRSVQVGDMGIGFPTKIPGRRSEPPLDAMLSGNHRFIRGNHDSPVDCRQHPFYIQDGTIENNIMYIGGAYSIDKDFRIPGVSYWPDEELSEQQFEMLLHDYMSAAPDIMITHEIPECIADEMCRQVGWKKFNIPNSNRTRISLERMWLNHKPKLWVAGHWHKSWDKNIMGTRFIVLNELEYIDVDLDLEESEC